MLFTNEREEGDRRKTTERGTKLKIRNGTKENETIKESIKKKTKGVVSEKKKREKRKRTDSDTEQN